MKIISKYKDYYDYLMGIFGEDPKLILDRRVHTQPYFFLDPQAITLFICGKLIQGFYDGESFYYGEALSKFGDIVNTASHRYYHYDDTRHRVVYFKMKSPRTTGYSQYRINVDILDDPTHINIKENCPILMASIIGSTYYRFPILEKLNVGSILPPEEIYQMLTQWLSDRIKDSEVIVDNRNDIDKLLSKGFDKRESFRPKIKIK